VECSLRNAKGGVRARKDFKIGIPNYVKASPLISSIEFAQAVDTVGQDTLFMKGDKIIIPSVVREYGGSSSAFLLYYHEIYQGKYDKETIKIESQILNDKYDAVYRDTLTSSFSEGIIRQLRQISLTGMRAGNYYLEVKLIGRREKVVDQVRGSFRISWSPEALAENDIELAIHQLKYIAEPREMKKLKEATTTEEKIRRWNEFWFVRDPTPGTAENEAKKDYYRRIDYANENFSVMKKEGWLTDRGMVYIIYGEPDIIEDFPFEIDRKSYQVWHYYKHGNKREFTFVDDWGDGDFKLQYPYDGIIR
jgi:GWxTD domain-containing protein